MNHVLVTGASGHVGFVLVKQLVERGYRVRAGVRQPDDEARTRPLRKLGVELVRVELLQRETIARAVHGVQGVFHVASALKLWAPNPDEEIFRPTVEGAAAVLEEAHAAGVASVVMTSSIGAVGLDASPGHPLTEKDWNRRPGLPYIRAKLAAEEAAWQIAAAHGMRLVTILPGMILGPLFQRITPSTALIDMIVRRKFPGVPPIGSCFVDVRDVAQLHWRAYENPAASGRFLATHGRFVTMRKLAMLVRQADPSLKVRDNVLPRWTLPIGVFLDWLGHLLLGRPRETTFDMLAEFTDRFVCYDLSRTRQVLGWHPIGLRQSVRDTVEWLKHRACRNKDQCPSTNA